MSQDAPHNIRQLDDVDIENQSNDSFEHFKVPANTKVVLK
jgi:hypothetical protein